MQLSSATPAPLEGSVSAKEKPYLPAASVRAFPLIAVLGRPAVQEQGFSML